MGELRDVAGLPLRRIYRLFPSKDELIVAFLRRRHERMMAAIEGPRSTITSTSIRALVTRAVLEARRGVQMLLAGARAGVETGRRNRKNRPCLCEQEGGYGGGGGI